MNALARLVCSDEFQRWNVHPNKIRATGHESFTPSYSTNAFETSNNALACSTFNVIYCKSNITHIAFVYGLRMYYLYSCSFSSTLMMSFLLR